MGQALHEYRDEASGRVSEYRALARREGQLHKAWRKLAERPAIRFWLREEERELLEEWRARPHPVQQGRMVGISEDDDPTIEPDISPLETDGGLLWEDARGSAL